LPDSSSLALPLSASLQRRTITASSLPRPGIAYIATTLFPLLDREGNPREGTALRNLSNNLFA
jgi:hypothetical protein